MNAQIIRLPEAATSLSEAYLRGLPSEPTRKAYRRCLHQFSSWFARPSLSASRRDIEAWRAHLEELGRAPSTISRSLTALSGFFDFALDEGAVDINPAARARRPRIPQTSPRRGLPRRQVRAIFAAIDPTTLLGARDRAMLTLLAIQGLRVSEAVGLQVEDLAEEQGHHVATIHGKGGKVCRVPLAAATVEALRTWLDRAEIRRGPILVAVGREGEVKAGAIHRSTAWERLATLARRAGIKEPVFPHRLRHTAVSEALQAGVPLHQVQDFARHSDPKTTRRYDSHRQSLNNPSAHILAGALLGS